MNRFRNQINKKRRLNYIKRILAISDIHGCYNELLKLLDLANYDSAEDQLILLGDYVDRGQKSKQVLDEVIKLVDYGAIALRGNHCQMFMDWLFTTSYNAEYDFLNNGGLQTLESYMGYEWFQNGLTHDSIYKAKQFIRDNYKDHLVFLHDTKLYHEEDGHLFIHAGFNPSLPDWKDTSRDEMIWIRDEFLNIDHSYDFTVVHGHTPTLHIHNSHDIHFGSKKIGIDGACAYGGQLNCLEIKDGKYKQYEIKRNSN